jgi:murein DD-endopeptidase MepM/ murein hydrolase activator NlpD
VLAVLLLLGLGQAQAEALELRGNQMQGGLIFGKTLPGSRVAQDGAQVRVSPAGDFLLGFERDAPASSRLSIDLPDGQRIERALQVKQRIYDIQRLDGLPKDKVTPDPAQEARIAREQALVESARTRDDARSDFLSGFRWPALGRISGVYGSQRILNGEPKRPHFGVDVAGPVGTPVFAPAPGIVTLVHPDMFYTGGTLILDHGQGLSSTFIHLSKLLVKEGDKIAAGDVIARIGATGRVTGPHLDWRVNLFTKRLDPQLLAGPMPDKGEKKP